MIYLVKLLLLFAFSSLIMAQENNEPFKDIESQIENKIDKKVAPNPAVNRSVRKKKIGKIIRNPLTYVSVNEYQLKGVFIGEDNDTAFAIVSTDDIQDQVVTIGDELGKEKYIIYFIKKNKIIVGQNNNLEDKRSIVINLVD